MDSLIFHNNHMMPLPEARLSPGQMGLLQGWGVFTTLRLYQGLPFAFDRHWERMLRDAVRLGIAFDYHKEAIRQAIVKLAAANHRPEGAARVSFIKNEGGLWAGSTGGPPTDVLIFTRPLPAWPPYHRLMLVPNAIFSAGKLAGAKMLSWVENARTLERVRAEGYDDALLLNEHGNLVECTSANIFLVRGLQIFTPPLTSGCLPGITRETLREVVPAAGYALLEQDLTPSNLDSAEEIFVSSTTREVAGVGSIQPNWKYSAPGKITQEITAAFQKYVQGHLRRAPAAQS
jgi:branched-chain amino acid aminotransferase